MRTKPRGAVADVLATSVSSLFGDELVSAADADAALSSSSELWDQALRGEAVHQGVEKGKLGVGQGPVVRFSVTAGGDWGNVGAGAGAGTGGELPLAARLPLWERERGNDARVGEASGWGSGSGSGLGIGAREEISEERAELLYQMFIAEQIYGDK
ncbi:hypothetical protein BS50DRAFT_567524 [Corynespora cassiicola Philippines]|uniref:Uncharacterized protein n=1 Tax=Corynespora cassiicola Philippines TaxID=1448308 RepID=A0A2T2PBH6_CORCC|nr:hypothetical protein BS50DRAFT_567524 [Corynespora cassiicola Philippines]